MSRRGTAVSLKVLGMALLWLVLVTGSSRSADTARDIELKIVELTNQQRERQGLPALEEMPALERAANGHSQEMCRMNYFDHTSPTPGRTEPWDRTEREGAPSDMVSENIYKSTGSQATEIPTAAVTAWMKSPDHRSNILDRGARYVGVGVAFKGKTVWITQVFCGPPSKF